MIDLNKLFEVIKKQGATGVLGLWLWYTHTEVQELKQRLYDCYGKNVSYSVHNPVQDSTTYAVVPKDEINEE